MGKADDDFIVLPADTRLCPARDLFMGVVQVYYPGPVDRLLLFP
jgi:hypothetical protein